MKKIIKWAVLWILSFISLVCVCLISFTLFNFFNGNFHTVIDHQVYRSAQLQPSDLEHYIKKYAIKSIINLRNALKSRPELLKNEMLVAQKYHLNYYHIELPAQHAPKVADLRRLVNVLATAPKPILIHCKAGADRTGLASAISVILAGNESIDDMEDQISWQYNVYSNTTIGYQTISNYLNWLATTGRKNSKENFLTWVNTITGLKPYFGWFLT
jgi:protein tyrosine/serine phosphatase